MEFLAAQAPQTSQEVATKPVDPTQPLKQHKWKATKDQIVQYWRTLRADTPILMRPIEYTHKGSSYGEDGVRLTGSPQFIASVLARLKEFLNFENPTTKLALVYRETESPSQAAMGQNKTSYVFYIQARERGVNPKTDKFQ